MHAHRHGDAGYRLGLEASAVGAGVALALVAAHNRGMQAIEERQQEQEWADINARLDNAVRLEAEVDRLALELAGERADNARLRRQLAQAQRWIESQREHRAA